MGDGRYTMGIDLGQTRNYTALLVMKREWKQGTAGEARTRSRDAFGPML